MFAYQRRPCATNRESARRVPVVGPPSEKMAGANRPAGRGESVRRTISWGAVAAVAVVAVACGSSGGGGGSDDAAPTTTTTTETAAPVDYSNRGPYAVGEVDLELDADHQIAVFYPVDRDSLADDATPYTYSGEDIFGPEIVDLLPGALAGEIAPPDTWLEAPASQDGPFPVVMHSHGAAGNLRFANFHNSHVASWGYVVAAVDHPERGVVAALSNATGGGGGGGSGSGSGSGSGGGCEAPDQSQAFLDSDQLAAGLELLGEENDTSGSALAGVVDTEQVAAEGHSAGGSASGTLAYDDRVDVWIGQAPGTPLEPGSDPGSYVSVTENADGGCDVEFETEQQLADTSAPSVPSMIIAAEGDSVISLDRVESIFAWLDTPKRLVVIADSGHAVFVDPCPLIQEEGGLSAFVSTLGLDSDDVPLVELGENGCLPTDTPAETVWAMIDHVTVAELNDVFDVDRAAAEASLAPEYLAEAFPDRFAREEVVD